MNQLGVQPLQAACPSCSCGYRDVQSPNERLLLIRGLSDALKKPGNSIPFEDLERRLIEVGIYIDTAGHQSPLYGNLSEFCIFAQRRAIAIIVDKRDTLELQKGIDMADCDGG